MEKIPNTFTTYALTQIEQKQAAEFTSVQKALIQNSIASIAEQKLNLKFDTTNPQEFIQENSYLQGQLDILKHLLDLSSYLSENN